MQSVTINECRSRINGMRRICINVPFTLNHALQLQKNKNSDYVCLFCATEHDTLFACQGQVYESSLSYYYEKQVLQMKDPTKSVGPVEPHFLFTMCNPCYNELLTKTSGWQDPFILFSDDTYFDCDYGSFQVD